MELNMHQQCIGQATGPLSMKYWSGVWHGMPVGNVTLPIRGAVYCRKVQQHVEVTTGECGTVCLWEMLVNIHSPEFVADATLTKT